MNSAWAIWALALAPLTTSAFTIWLVGEVGEFLSTFDTEEMQA